MFESMARETVTLVASKPSYYCYSCSIAFIYYFGEECITKSFIICSLLLDIFLVNYQRDTQIPFYVFVFFIYNPLHVSSASCSSSGATNCINTTSGNCHSVLVAVSCAHDTATNKE